MQPSGSNESFSAPWNWNAVRIALLHESVPRIVQKTTGDPRKEQNADSTLRTLCPDGFARIDDLLQLGSWNSRVLECTRHSRKVQRMGGAIEQAGEVGLGVRQKRRYVRCGSMRSKMAAYMRA